MCEVGNNDNFRTFACELLGARGWMSPRAKILGEAWAPWAKQSPHSALMYCNLHTHFVFRMWFHRFHSRRAYSIYFSSCFTVHWVLCFYCVFIFLLISLFGYYSINICCCILLIPTPSIFHFFHKFHRLQDRWLTTHSALYSTASFRSQRPKVIAVILC